MKKISSILLLIIVLYVCVVYIATFAPQPIEKPDDTNLELWITEGVDSNTFADCKWGDMNVRFANRSYVKEGVDVCYEVGAYPDYTNNNECIVGIEIRDPNINIYGLSINSTSDDFINTMSANGYELIDSLEKYTKKYAIDKRIDESNMLVAVKKREMIIYYPQQQVISIIALVSNGFRMK